MTRDIDVHVGWRVRQRRMARGMTQIALAEAVGVRFQQIQKYEMGTNRISASRLWDIAAVLEVPIAYFFEDVRAAERCADLAQDGLALDHDAVELLRAYGRVPDAQRQGILILVRGLASLAAEPELPPLCAAE